MNNFINIKQYGFSEMFSKEIPQDSPLEPARVLSQEKGFYRIITDKGEKLAEVSGKFRYQATFSSEYPAVGDFVLVNWNESGNYRISAAAKKRFYPKSSRRTSTGTDCCCKYRYDISLHGIKQ